MITVEELDLQIEALNYAMATILEAKTPEERDQNKFVTLSVMRLDLLKRKHRLTHAA